MATIMHIGEGDGRRLATITEDFPDVVVTVLNGDIKTEVRIGIDRGAITSEGYRIDTIRADFYTWHLVGSRGVSNSLPPTTQGD